MPGPPPVFTTCCQFWDIDRRLQRVWWVALCQARWSQAVEWRQKLGMYHSTRLIAPKKLLHEVCSPAETVKILEGLVREGRLERRCATTIEEHIFHYTNSRGGWYGGSPGARPT